MKNNSTKMILTFLAGLLIGGAVIWFFFCGCCKKSCEHYSQIGNFPQPVTIDTTTAQTYFANYMLSPINVDTLKAFAVNLAQYNAMRMILDNDTTVTGFRIYMGATDTTHTSMINMVVGFGTPDHYTSIYATDSEESGPCPFVCDETSPITRDH